MGELRRVEIDMILLGQSAKARDVEYPGHRLELLFANPVLNFLLHNQVMTGALHSVSVDLTDWIFRRETRLRSLRQCDERQLIESLGAIEFVVAAPVEIQADVG